MTQSFIFFPTAVEVRALNVLNRCNYLIHREPHRVTIWRIVISSTESHRSSSMGKLENKPLDFYHLNSGNSYWLPFWVFYLQSLMKCVYWSPTSYSLFHEGTLAYRRRTIDWIILMEILSAGHMEAICFQYHSITQESAQGNDTTIPKEYALLHYWEIKFMQIFVVLQIWYNTYSGQCADHLQTIFAQQDFCGKRQLWFRSWFTT